eukprot:gene19585-6776_t
MGLVLDTASSHMVLEHVDKINEKCNVFLASQSPRRKSILEMLGLKFQVFTTDAEETSKPDHTKMDMDDFVK